MSKELYQYWDDRAFKNVYASLPAVGNIGWGLEINKYFYQRQIDEIDQLGYDWNGKKLLDAGCGIGFFSRYFEDHGANVIGVDFSEKMINVAKKNASKSDFILSNLTQLPFKNDSFDYIFTSNVFIHIVADDEWERAVSELKYVLKKGGKIIFIQQFRDFHPTNSKIDYFRLRDEIRYQKVLNMEKIYNNKFLFFIQHFAPLLRIIYTICVKILYFLDKYMNFGEHKIIVYKK